MTLLSLSPTFRHSLFVHPIPQSHGCYRLPFGLFLRYISGSSIPSPSLTFEKLGVARNVCAGLQEAYPEVVQPTETQSRLIPAVLAGKDVLLKDSTGSGKTFGLLLALLSKPYRYVPSKFGVKSEKSPVTSSLLITPHRDLAFQCLHWIKSIHSHVPSSNLSSIAQVLVRGAPNFPSDQLSLLQKTPPLILMGTPQAFLEILEKDPHALRLRTLSTVVVDEADYLIEYMPLAADKYDRIKYQRTLKNHPSPTRQILDYIYCPNRFYNVDRKGKKYEDPKRSIPEQEFGFRRPQLVLSSATLKAQLRRSLMMEAGWLTQVDGDLAKISGKGGERPSQEVLATNALGGRSMVHCALVVYEDGSIKNIGSAVEADPKSSNTVVVDDGEGNVNQGEEGDRTLVDVETEEGGSVADVGMSGVEEEKGVALVSEEDEAAFSRKASPFNVNALEAVSAAFALDVPRVALLVLPSSAPVRRAVYDLRKLGVNAQGLDILDDERGGAYLVGKGTDVMSDKPTLLVSTMASTRGLDLPDLTHVFLLGVPEDRSVDSYLHAAGRVGRFGKSGKVISILEARHKVRKAKGGMGMKDDPCWFGQTFATIGVKPTKLVHFE